MKKTTRHSRSKKRRHVYPYVCAHCGKKRLAFVFERAKRKECSNCEVKNFVNENQKSIFDPT